MCTERQQKNITNEITKGVQGILGDKLRKIILYGSYARGNYDNESDIDILVLADVSSEDLYPYKDKIHDITSELGLENNIMISVFLKNRDHFYEWIDASVYYQNVMKDGVTLYEPQSGIVQISRSAGGAVS